MRRRSSTPEGASLGSVSTEAAKAAPRRRVGLVVALLLALTGCLRPPEPPPPQARFGASHRVRLFDDHGGSLGAFRVRRRSVAVSDASGIRLGRAVALPGRIEVRDRRADLQWTLRTEGEGSADGSTVRTRIEAGTGTLVGYLELSETGARVLNAAGAQIGEVRRVSPESDEEPGGEVYGAPGTDLLGRIVESGHRVVDVEGFDDVPLARVDGLDLDARAVGLMVLPAPDLTSGAPSPESERLYAAGVLLFVRMYGD